MNKMAISRAAQALAGFSLMAAFVLASAIDPAHAETGAPIVYKSMPAEGSVSPVALYNGMSLNIAPQAPVPTFASSVDTSAKAGSQTLRPVFPGSAVLPQTAPVLRSATADLTDGVAEPYAGPAYQVNGKWYVPAHEPNYDEIGIASWYGPTFHGKASASGETFDENALTAAHPTLPIPSLVRVTNLDNGRAVIVRLNDRGPFVDDRIIDLSRGAAGLLDMHGPGTARVRVQYVGPVSADTNAVTGSAFGSEAPAQGIVSRSLGPVTPMAPPAAPISRPAGDTGGSVFLQAGSFADLGNANMLREKLRSVGAVSIKAVDVNGLEYYRVMLGPWSSREEAEQISHQLARTGLQSLIVTSDP